MPYLKAWLFLWVIFIAGGCSSVSSVSREPDVPKRSPANKPTAAESRFWELWQSGRKIEADTILAEVTRRDPFNSRLMLLRSLALKRLPEKQAEILPHLRLWWKTEVGRPGPPDLGDDAWMELKPELVYILNYRRREPCGYLYSRYWGFPFDEKALPGLYDQITPHFPDDPLTCGVVLRHWFITNLPESEEKQAVFEILRQRGVDHPEWWGICPEPQKVLEHFRKTGKDSDDFYPWLMASGSVGDPHLRHFLVEETDCERLERAMVRWKEEGRLGAIKVLQLLVFDRDIGKRTPKLLDTLVWVSERENGFPPSAYHNVRWAVEALVNVFPWYRYRPGQNIEIPHLVLDGRTVSALRDLLNRTDGAKRSEYTAFLNPAIHRVLDVSNAASQLDLKAIPQLLKKADAAGELSAVAPHGVASLVAYVLSVSKAPWEERAEFVVALFPENLVDGQNGVAHPSGSSFSRVDLIKELFDAVPPDKTLPLLQQLAKRPDFPSAELDLDWQVRFVVRHVFDYGRLPRENGETVLRHVKEAQQFLPTEIEAELFWYLCTTETGWRVPPVFSERMETLFREQAADTDNWAARCWLMASQTIRFRAGVIEMAPEAWRFLDDLRMSPLDRLVWAAWMVEEIGERPVPEEIKTAWRKLAPLLSAEDARKLVLRGWEKTTFHRLDDPIPDREGLRLAEQIERLAEEAE